MKLYKFSLLIISVFILFACEKETEGISRVTEYASFEMQGSDFMFITKNSTFSDPGIKAFQGDTELPIETKGSVDTSTPGVYTLVYSATNSDGFPASVQRTVAVVAAIPTKDLSGNYQVVHATRTNKMTVSKKSGIVGYYRASDSWWQNSAIPLDFVDMGDGKILVLNGASGYGRHVDAGSTLVANQLNFKITLIDQASPVTYNTIWKLVQ